MHIMLALAMSIADPVPSSPGPLPLLAPAISCLPPQLLDQGEPLSCQQPSLSTLDHQRMGPEAPDRKGRGSQLGLLGPTL